MKTHWKKVIEKRKRALEEKTLRVKRQKNVFTLGSFSNQSRYTVFGQELSDICFFPFVLFLKKTESQSNVLQLS